MAQHDYIQSVVAALVERGAVAGMIDLSIIRGMYETAIQYGRTPVQTAILAMYITSDLRRLGF